MEKQQHVGWAKERSDVPIRIQRYDDGHGPSGLCPSYGFFATIGFIIIGLLPSIMTGKLQGVAYTLSKRSFRKPLSGNVQPILV